MSAAERQQKYRDKLKAKDIKPVPIKLSKDDRDLLDLCREAANDPCCTVEEFRRTALIRGAVFMANSGDGRKVRRAPNSNRYYITEEN